jgi:hypothetical protein
MERRTVADYNGSFEVSLEEMYEHETKNSCWFADLLAFKGVIR